MKREEYRFRLLERPSRMNIYLPYQGEVIISEDVLNYLAWHEIDNIDENLKQIAKEKRKGFSRGLSLIDYTQKTIFAVGHTLRDYMIFRDFNKSGEEIFAPVASEKKYISKTNTYNKNNFHILDTINHYVINVLHVYKNHSNETENLRELSDHIEYIDKNLEGDYWF